jgi:hypothetical protein
MEDFVVKPALAILLSFLSGGVFGLFGSLYILHKFFDKDCDFSEPEVDEEEQNDF